MILELAEVARERDVLGARDVLVAEEQDLCFSSSARISATSSASREATPRFTLESSAPIVQVSGSTLIEVFSDFALTTAGASGAAVDCDIVRSPWSRALFGPDRFSVCGVVAGS